MRYLPYGEERWANGESVTDFGFTSQRAERGFGLMDYNARYYSPYLGRFISPDMMVPNPGQSIGWNRYAYAHNNPMRYTDPSGHFIETVWDVANVIAGAASLGYNLSQGNYTDAAIDAGGLVIDVAAAAIPVVPGGAGAAIKAVRLANKVDNVVDTANAVDNAVDAVNQIDNLVDTTNAVDNVVDVENIANGPDVIYRTGSQTDNALTDPTGVSFRDSISSSANGEQVFRPGDKLYAVDTSKLPSGSVVPDGKPPGHVSVNASPQQIRDAIIPQGPSNPIDPFNLKLLEDGSSYRIPKR